MNARRVGVGCLALLVLLTLGCGSASNDHSEQSAATKHLVLKPLDVQHAFVGQEWQIKVESTPPETLQLAWALEPPTGIELDAQHSCRWVAAENQVGSYILVLKASTKAGKSTLMPIRVLVRQPFQPPSVAAVPQHRIVLDQPWQYQIPATDPNEPPVGLRFELGPMSPVGLQLDSKTGRLSWTPNGPQVLGTNLITVKCILDHPPNLETDVTLLVQVETPPVNSPPTTSPPVATIPNKSPPISSPPVAFPPPLTPTPGVPTRATVPAALLARFSQPATQASLDAALKWLAEHQMFNNGWSFQHGTNNNHVSSVNQPGTEPSTTGATGLALLCFLHAGHTHRTGTYSRNVQRGLQYLAFQGQYNPATGADLRGRETGSTMYSHAIAAWAMCEAYGRTKDNTLATPTQQALDFIINAQDSQGGGWRYAPAQAGDTSVTGWQFLALDAARNATLTIPQATWEKSRTFLNSTQTGGGSHYGYLSPGTRSTTSAIGLNCRMCLGWNRSFNPLNTGIQSLVRQGYSSTDIYHNFWVTQALSRYGGKEWEDWRTKAAAELIASQVQTGGPSFELGSWTPVGTYETSTKGGRLCQTALSALMLAQCLNPPANR